MKVVFPVWALCRQRDLNQKCELRLSCVLRILGAWLEAMPSLLRVEVKGEAELFDIALVKDICLA